MAKKAKHLRITTPAGIARYPWLNTPDTKWVKTGQYKTDLILTEEQLDEPLKVKNAEYDGMSLREILEKVRDDRFDEEYAKAKPAVQKKLSKADPFHVEEDDDGEETGRYFIRAKLKALVKTETVEFEQAPRLVDAKKQELTENIYGGSIIKLNIEVVSYYSAKDKEVGVTLRVKAVQVLEMAEYEAEDDFDEEEGFESSGEKPKKSTRTPADDADDDDDGDDDDF